MVQDSLDANLIVHFIIGDPVNQSRKVWKFLTTSKDRHHISTIALSEACYVLEKVYGYSRASFVAELQDFLTTFSNVLDYNHALLDLTLPYYLNHPSLSFNDCLLAFDAELTHSEPLFTFDHKLSHQHASAKLLT